MPRIMKARAVHPAHDARGRRHAKTRGRCLAQETPQAEHAVGVEDDEWVRRWKGPERPIQSEEDRCELLLALRMVDHVFVISGERVVPDYYLELLCCHLAHQVQY